MVPYEGHMLVFFHWGGRLEAYYNIKYHKQAFKKHELLDTVIIIILFLFLIIIYNILVVCLKFYFPCRK
jgi:hypothetical protein